MRVLFFSNRFPEEDAAGLFRRIRVQSALPEHVILRKLLDEVTDAMRDEIGLLQPELRDSIPPFRSILDLAEGYEWHKSPLAGVFECVFLCLLPLGLFAGDYETNTTSPPAWDDNSVCTGLGLGSLGVTAIAASRSVLDLPRTAAEVIRIAFRTGLVVYKRAQEIEPQEPSSVLKSWTTIVKGLSEDIVREELEIFNSSSRVPAPNQIYISVVEPDGTVFVNGPPSQLQALFRSEGRIKSAPKAPLPVYGPCHAAHLYDQSHVEYIMETVSHEVANRSCSEGSVLSMADGTPLLCNTALELFVAATWILLTQIIRWEEVVTSIKDASWWKDGMPVQVETCRPSLLIQSLVSDLQAHHPQSSVSIHDLAAWKSPSPNPAPNSNEIAIVGMSCRFPGANDLSEFWSLLQSGRDMVTQIPADRYNVSTHTDPTGKRPNTSLTPFGCFLESPGLFDAGFFNMSPREAGQTDPTHRLALLTAYEALEMAGYVPDRTPSTTAETVSTVYGHCSDDYREANAGQDIDMYFIPGNYRAFAPGRISYFFGFSGPSYSLDTACSASLVAVQTACGVLARREANMAVAGGLNVLTGSDSFAGLSRAFFLSSTGNCKVFDDAADGYCRGDGVGSIVLKRLDDAQRDNDNVLGVILGSGTNHSSAAVSITHPHAPTQASLFRSVLRDAGVSPMDVDLVEMHGTGTQAGDAAEMESVTSVFSPPGTKRSNKLYVSSVKGNIGHGEAAAGIAALIKAVLILQQGSIPRHIGIKTRLNSHFPDLKRLNIHIPDETVLWPPDPARRRYVMVNNFSAAGGNTSLLLAEPPTKPDVLEKCAQTRFVVTVSAKSNISLTGNLSRMIQYLEDNPRTHLPSLAYTTTGRRTHHSRRVAVHGSSTEEIVTALKRRLPGLESRKRADPQSVAFVFSGQGSFYLGIGHGLIEGYPSYRDSINALDQLCLLHGFPSIMSAMTDVAQDAEEISPLTEQLTTVCVQIALCQLWRSLGVKPDIVVGASLGEYAALYAAGVLSASDAIYLVGQRALLMQDLCTPHSHTMLAVQASEKELRSCLQPGITSYEVACINAPRSLTLSGLESDINEIQRHLKGSGIRSTKLTVPFAFHSTQMEEILEGYEQVIKTVTIKPPKISLVSPLLGDVISQGQPLPDSYLQSATRNTIHLGPALQKAFEDCVLTPQTRWIEIGANQTYSSAVAACVPNTEVIVPSLKKDEDNWCTLAKSMAALHESGVNINWSEWFRPFEEKTYVRLLDLPGYSWDLKNHWIQHNGHWLLTKDKGSSDVDGQGRSPSKSTPSALCTPLLHEVVDERISDGGGTLTMQSDVHADDFFAVASGHKMAGRAVVSVFSYPDMVLTMARYMLKRLIPDAAITCLAIANVTIIQGLIPKRDRSVPQLVGVNLDCTCTDERPFTSDFSIYTTTTDGSQLDELATGSVTSGNASTWKQNWSGLTHLLTSRISTLRHLATEGKANNLTRETVYTLFQSIVDYADPYRGIQSAIIYGLEAVADIVLPSSQEGTWKWTAPPNYIDALSHIAGFVLNSGLDPSTNTKDTMYVMAGWEAMMLAETLLPETRYTSYVRMEAARDGSGLYVGDLYVLRGEEVIGVVKGVALRPLPRVLMGRFFDPPDDGHEDQLLVQQKAKRDSRDVTSASVSTSDSSRRDAANGPPVFTPDTTSASASISKAPSKSTFPTAVTPSPETKHAHAKAQKALSIIAAEVGVGVEELTDDVTLDALGVDSLLSLVLSEKFAIELDIRLPASFFLDGPSVSEIRGDVGDASG